MVKKSPVILLCMLLLALPFQGKAGESPYYPVESLRYYAEFHASGCTLCSARDLENAIGGLEKVFRAGIVISGNGVFFVKTVDCADNELVIKQDAFPRVFATRRGTVYYYPPVVLRFHTLNRDMTGIEKKNYTDTRWQNVYDSGSGFSGAVKTVHYRHGDGSSFAYDQSRHVLVVHCQVLHLVKSE